MAIKLDPETEGRLRRFAEVLQTSPEVIFREAIAKYLEREEEPEQADPDRHPSGQPWPRRNPVGGIITPV